MEHKKISFIYWFAYYHLESPSVRYRGKYPLTFFKDYLGIPSYFVMPGYKLDSILLFVKAYLSALINRKPNSLIVIQRVQSNFIYASLLKLLIKLRKKDTVFDIDDADYLHNNPQTIYYFATHCEYVSVGSELIKKHLESYNPNIIHTTTPIVDLNIVKQQRNKTFVIGWIGAYGGDNKHSLHAFIFPALKLLSFPCKFILVGVNEEIEREWIKQYFKNSPFVEIEIPLSVDWNNEKEIQMRIANFDIGIATLMHTSYQLSKSGIKAKQYLNNGVPVLSSNLPENNNFVVHGRNGYFCSSINEFHCRLTEFYRMSNDEYLQFSINARQSITYFDHHNFFKTLNEIKLKQ